jgi:hypothetical protein
MMEQIMQADEIARLIKAVQEEGSRIPEMGRVLSTLSLKDQESFQALNISPLALFSALDTLRMCLGNTGGQLILTSLGDFLRARDGDPLFSAIPFVRTMAGLSVEEANSLIAWIVDTAKSYPNLVPGVTALRDDDGVLLTLVG